MIYEVAHAVAWELADESGPKRIEAESAKDAAISYIMATDLPVKHPPDLSVIVASRDRRGRRIEERWYTFATTDRDGKPVRHFFQQPNRDRG